jgi:hypothetical protein
MSSQDQRDDITVPPTLLSRADEGRIIVAASALFAAVHESQSIDGTTQS